MFSTLTYKFTTSQYHQLYEKEVLPLDSKVELIDGEIINMSPIGIRHGMTVKRLNAFFSVNLFQKAVVSIQDPIQLGDYSEPQPDLALLRYRKDFYGEHLPQEKDVLLIIEVADSTYKYDREIKIPLYSKFNIPEVWLMDLNRQKLERFTDPKLGEYQQRTIFLQNQTICSQAFPDLSLDLTDIFVN